MTTKKAVIKKDSISQAIAVKIAKYLLDTGNQLTVADVSTMFGEFADVSPTALTQIASSNYTPSLYVAMSLSKFLEIEIDDLFEVLEVND